MILLKIDKIAAISNRALKMGFASVCVDGVIDGLAAHQRPNLEQQNPDFLWMDG